MGDWKEHKSRGGYNCSRPKQTLGQLRQEQGQMEKYNFYRERFGQHWNALQYALRKKRITLHNFRSIMNFTEFPKDESFLTEVFDLLIDARRAISMTYAAGEYRKSIGFKTDIFEIQQSLLWTVLDQLDKFTDPLEKEAEMKDLLVDYIQGRVFLDEKFNAYKSELMHKAEAVKVACNALLKAIEEENSNLSIVEKQEKLETEKEDNLSTEESSVNEEWNCGFCTFQNQGLSERCGACDNVKRVFGFSDDLQ